MRGDFFYDVWLDEHDFGNQVDLVFVQIFDGEASASLRPDGQWAAVKDGARIEPTLTLHRKTMDALAKKMIEWAGRKNMRTEPEAKLQGQLEAVRYHLEDLRVLLKLKNHE